MAKWRPIDTRLWSDRKFMSLNDDGKLLWLWLLTSPFGTPIPGVIVSGEMAIAENLNWTVERYRKGYRELLTKGLSIRLDGRLIWLPKALQYQKICGPKHITSMAKCWDDVPDVDLKVEVYEALKIACKSWSKLYEKGFAIPHPKGIGRGIVYPKAQDQDQDLDQEQERGAGVPPVLSLCLPVEPDHADPVAEFATAAIAEINRLARTSFKPDSAETTRNSQALVKRKRTPSDAIAVVRSKQEWLRNDRMQGQFKPSVLLRPNNFDRYLEELQAKKPQPKAATPDVAPALSAIGSTLDLEGGAA